jgi:hypothetical protein
MNIKESKIINIIGIILWIFIFFMIVPTNIIIDNPIILLGFVYTILILYLNIYFVGDKTSNNASNLDTDSITLVNLLNNKAIEISSAVFAIAMATQRTFNSKTYKIILLFMSYTLIFGVGIIIPIYFITNQTQYKLDYYNNYLIKIRNISLSYGVGFLTCTILYLINKLLC